MYYIFEIKTYINQNYILIIITINFLRKKENMKYFTTAVALIALLGVASGQTILGARQCVECVYWGGNWCPSGTATTLTANNGVCSSATSTTCAANYAMSASSCVQVTNHATKTTCAAVNLDLSSDMANTTRTFTWTQTLNFNSYCQVDLAITNNDNASVSYTFTPTGGSLVVQSASETAFTNYISNVTNTARTGSVGTGVMGTGKTS